MTRSSLLMNWIRSLLVAVIVAGVVGMPVPNAYAASPDSPTTLLARVDALNNQVDQANAKVDAATRKIAEDQKLEASLNLQIAALARLQYKRPVLVVQFFEAGSVSQVLADITNDRLMADKQSSLLLQARELRHEDQLARDSAEASAATLTASRDSAKKLADQAVAQRNAELAERARAI